MRIVKTNQKKGCMFPWFCKNTLMVNVNTNNPNY